MKEEIKTTEARAKEARKFVDKMITYGKRGDLTSRRKALAFLRNDNKVQSDMHRMYELFPRLAERKHQLAGTLSGGEQQMLAMARALMNKPKLLLLDEPSMGLSPILVNEIFDIIKTINKEEGVTVLLVEQNASKALSIANKAYVLETGKITIGGNAKEVANNPKVREAYLG